MFRKLWLHLTFILAELFLVLNILDSYNPTMGFLTSAPSKALLALLCLLVVAGLGWHLTGERRGKHLK